MAQASASDLHIHSHFSDGTFSPAEIVEIARRSNLTHIAITDHDTTEGVAEEVEAGRKEGVKTIPALELSTDFEGREIHLAGLFIDTANKKLRRFLQKMRTERTERIYRMCEKLEELNVTISPGEILALAGHGSPGRPHVAHAMLRAGIVTTISEAFHKYLGDGRRAYVPKSPLAPRKAVELIRQAQGLAVLCHPGETPDDDLIRKFYHFGIDAIEAFYPTYQESTVQGYIELARKYGLGISGGSDCHGFRKEQVLVGSVRVPDSFVSDLYRRSGNRGF